MAVIRKQRLAIVYFLGLGAVFTTLGVFQAWQDYRLTHAGIVTTATVTEKRFTSNAPGPGIYTVRYQYAVGTETFTYQDFFGTKNLWAALPRSQWMNLSTRGQLPIRYLEEIPRLSRPIGSLSGTHGYRTSLILGVVLTGLGLLVLRRRRHADRRVWD